MLGNKDDRDVERIGDVAGVKAARTAKGQQSKVSWVVAATHGNDANRSLHIGVRDPYYALNQCGYGQAEAAGELLRDTACAGEIEGHATAKKVFRIEPPQEEIRVGDGQLYAFAVAGWAGICACASRSDPQRSAGVDVGNRSTASAYGVDVQHGQADGKVTDGRFDRRADGSVDEADIG